MKSGESCVMVLCSPEDSKESPIAIWKEIIGPMDPEQAKKTAPESLRAKHGTSIVKN